MFSLSALDNANWVTSDSNNGKINYYADLNEKENLLQYPLKKKKLLLEKKKKKKKKIEKIWNSNKNK